MRWQGPGPKGKYEGGTRNGARGKGWSSHTTWLSNREKAALSGPGTLKRAERKERREEGVVNSRSQVRATEGTVRADLGGHLKYSQRWSGVRAGVLLGAQGAVRRGKNRGGL